MSATTLPFAGGELCDFDPYDSNCIESTASAGTLYDPIYARCAIAISGNVSGCNSPKWPDASTFWFHGELYVSGGNAFLGEVWAYNWQNNAGTTVFVMSAQSLVVGVSATYRCYTLQSGVMTLVGSFVLPIGRQKIDIELVSNTALGTLNVYVSGTNRLPATGLNHSGFAGVGQVSLRGSYAVTQAAFHSQIICDTVSHIGDVVGTCAPTGNGANTAWVGDYTSVNETVYSDASKITSTAANDIETDVSSASFSGQVYAVVVSARSNCGSTGPQNLQLALRRGGTNYFSSSIAQNPGLQATQNAWKTDPSTSTTWVMADALAAEFGVKAIA